GRAGQRILALRGLSKATAGFTAPPLLDRVVRGSTSTGFSPNRRTTPEASPDMTTASTIIWEGTTGAKSFPLSNQTWQAGWTRSGSGPWRRPPNRFARGCTNGFAATRRGLWRPGASTAAHHGTSRPMDFTSNSMVTFG